MPAVALPDPPLSDGAVTLRGFDSADVAALVEICRDPEIPRWTGVPSPYSARALVQRPETAHVVNDVYFARMRTDG